ncbi:MAG: hypothetical protein ACRDK4_11180 [Solirubrobacteraceae bacterium]
MEADALRKHASLPGSEIHGPSAESLVRDADARYKRLRGLMPLACPEDWRLVGSRPLLGEYERKLRESGPKLDPALRPEDVETARRQIQSVCVEMTDDFDPATVPRYTTDRSDDAVVHTALLANATWLIADDRKHISTDPDGITREDWTEPHLRGKTDLAGEVKVMLSNTANGDWSTSRGTKLHRGQDGPPRSARRDEAAVGLINMMSFESSLHQPQLISLSSGCHVGSAVVGRLSMARRVWRNAAPSLTSTISLSARRIRPACSRASSKGCTLLVPIIRRS